MARAFSLTINRDDVLSTLTTKFPSSATEDDYLDILNKIYTDFNAIVSVDTVSAADANRTASTYSSVAFTTSGSGTGATFNITVDANGAAAVTVVKGGTGYAVNETITVADSELGGGGAANLTFDVAVIATNPSKELNFNRNTNRTSTHRTLTAEFGDGYEQRVLDGINTKNETLSALFSNRVWQEIEVISAFLDAKAGRSFNIVLQRETLKVICENYNVTYTQPNVHTLSANLKRVYEP